MLESLIVPRVVMLGWFCWWGKQLCKVSEQSAYLETIYKAYKSQLTHKVKYKNQHQLDIVTCKTSHCSCRNIVTWRLGRSGRCTRSPQEKHQQKARHSRFGCRRWGWWGSVKWSRNKIRFLACPTSCSTDCEFLFTVGRLGTCAGNVSQKEDA